MASKLAFLVLAFYFWTLAIAAFAKDSKQFIYNGFQDSKLHLDGGALIHPNGLLQLTNTSQQQSGHAFHPTPINFKSSFSFSTTFVFAIYPETEDFGGHGIVFVLSSTPDFSRTGAPGEYLGLVNSTFTNFSKPVFAVELDTSQNLDLLDIDSNHVGIDVFNLVSVSSAPAGYFSDTEGQNKSLDLLGGKPMQVWIDYDQDDMVALVRMAPLGIPKPSKPLLSTRLNLTGIILDTMYAGFSSATGKVTTSSHYLLGWGFSHGGKAQRLDVSKLPSLPRLNHRKKRSNPSTIVLAIIISVVLITVGIVFYLVRRKKFEEILEDWEKDYLVQRFTYKDLYKATKGFKDRGLLGTGGFGKVYKGMLPASSTQVIEVAIKKVSHGSGQGMREFVAEVACMARLRHRNLVQLLGYCRRKRELLLVYEYMPNGSLDQYLYNDRKPSLLWSERFRIIKGVASALVYLHEEWEQVVVHRDVKASNVLLDADMSARLGDFGLARLYDHGTNAQTTHVVGTVGYMAPELTRRGKATTCTDVYSFGVLVLEVACGKSPIILQGSGEEKYLVDWVYDFWKQGKIVEASDPKLQEFSDIQEMELALKLGMICCHPKEEARPSMRQVLQIMAGDSVMPDTLVDAAKTSHFNQNSISFPFSSGGATAYSSYDSMLKVGR